MYKHFVANIVVSAVLLNCSVAFAQNAPTAGVGHYTTTDTPIGTLLDDTAAKAVLIKDIPDVVSNPQIALARGMTFTAFQPYSGGMLSDDKLAIIDADLKKLNPGSK